MKYKWKKLIVLSLVICMLGISATGCGSAPAAGKEVNAPTKLDTSEPITDEADDTETGDDTNLSTQADNVETGANDAKSGDTENSGTDPSDDAETKTENASESSGKWRVYDADLAVAVDADFEGDVQKIETDSFYIYPMETELMEDGALIMSSLSPDAGIPDEDLVKVVFNSDTVFILRDIYDGGGRHEDSDASFEDIEKGVLVSLKGEFQNDIFHANVIRISKVH